MNISGPLDQSVVLSFPLITLHYFDGMLCEEIAAFLGVTTNTIKSRLNRARNRLKKNESQVQSALDDFQTFAIL